MLFCFDTEETPRSRLRGGAGGADLATKKRRKGLRLLYPLASGLLAGWTAMMSEALGQMLQAYFLSPIVQ